MLRFVDLYVVICGYVIGVEQRLLGEVADVIVHKRVEDFVTFPSHDNQSSGSQPREVLGHASGVEGQDRGQLVHRVFVVE